MTEKFKKDKDFSIDKMVVDKIIKDIDEKGYLKWQRPYELYTAVNYITQIPYTGINALLLDGGEYLTKNQINDYNKKNNTSFKFQKGIKWHTIIYFSRAETTISKEEAYRNAEIRVDADTIYDGKPATYIGFSGSNSYYCIGSRYIKVYKFKKYTKVCEIKHLKDKDGNSLPSKRSMEHNIIFDNDKAETLYKDYIENEKIKLAETDGIPCYIPMLDKIKMNNHFANEEQWYSTLFHEIIHSTGHFSRMNRFKPGESKSDYALEECVAEFGSALLCRFVGITENTTSGSMVYENNIAYINHWKQLIKDMEKDFIRAVSVAERAYKFVLNAAQTEEKAV